MVQVDEKQQNVTTYEIDNKKYTVIARCVEDVEDTKDRKSTRLNSSHS